MPHLGTLPLTDARDLFILDCEARRLAPATRSFYTRKLRLVIRWLHAENVHNVEDVTPPHIRRYLVSIAARGLSSRHQHNLARAMRAFFNYLVRDGLLKESPFDKVRMPKMEKKIHETCITRFLGYAQPHYNRRVLICLLSNRDQSSIRCNVKMAELLQARKNIRYSIDNVS